MKNFIEPNLRSTALEILQMALLNQKGTLMDNLQVDNNYRCVLWLAENKLFHELCLKSGLKKGKISYLENLNK